MYALSKAAPERPFSVVRFVSPPDFRLWLVALSSGVTFKRVTSSTACLFTPVWSVTICCANILTSAFDVFDAASFPASISTWFAVTTIDAICASLGDWANTVEAGASATAAANNHIFIERLLGKSGSLTLMHVAALAFPGALQHGRNDAIAARAVKGEDVARGDIDVGGQRVAKQRPRAEEPGPHGGGRNPQRRRRLVHGHLFHFAHD